MERRTAIAAEIADVYRRGITAEVTAPVEPGAVHGHHMRIAVPAYGGEPVARRFNQPLLNRWPVQEPVRRAIAAGQAQLFRDRQHVSWVGLEIFLDGPEQH